MSWTADALLAELGLNDEQAANVGEGLAESLACQPAHQPTLTPAFARWGHEFARLRTELLEPLVRTTERIAADSALTAMFWHQYRWLYDQPDRPLDRAGAWPTWTDRLGAAECGCYYLLLSLAVLPRMIGRHAERGIPEPVSRECTTHFRESTRLYELTRPGQVGVAPRILFWQRNHLAGRLIQLGRFEYMLRPFPDRVTVWRRKADRAVVALARPGELYNADGYLDAGATEGWRSVYEETDRSVTGTAIHPAGHGLPDPVTLDRAEWELALHSGQTILEVHIPAGGRMSLDAALDSMRQAPAFFSRHFPEQPYVGFATHSWILDPRAWEWLGAESNMARWSRELYLTPYPSHGRDGLYFVFGEAEYDPARLPRDTSLKRAILAHLEAGGAVRAAGFFVLLDELDQLGSQPYRRLWPFGD